MVPRCISDNTTTFIKSFGVMGAQMMSIPLSTLIVPYIMARGDLYGK